MTYKKCAGCGGTLQYTGADLSYSYYECPCCGDRTMIPIASDGGAQLSFEARKKELFERLRRGLEDWRIINWDQLYKDFSDFIGAHDYLQDDLRCQLALIACLTKGFNQMDSNKETYCKALIKSVEKMYKQQKKDLKKQMKNPLLSDSLGDYESVRAKYDKLQRDYLSGKL